MWDAPESMLSLGYPMFVLQSLLHAIYVLIHHNRVYMHPKADKRRHRPPAFTGPESKHATRMVRNLFAWDFMMGWNVVKV